ncbi:MAG: GTP-binding protein TypA/BipA, partial [uncultured Solirubrobacterales bacterium]
PAAAHRAPGHLGGAGPRRAPARGAGRDHAPRGLRAHRGQAARGHPGRGRQGPRARGAPRGRRPRGLPRRGHTPACRASRAPREHGQPRHRLGPARLPRARPGPDRLSHRVPDRDARHRPAARGLRGLRAVARRDPHPADGFAGGRPPRRDRGLCPVQAPGAWPAVRGTGRAGLRGHGRRRERPRRGHGREPRQGEEADQRPRRLGRRARPSGPTPPALARPGARVHPRGRGRRGHARCAAAAQARARRHGAPEDGARAQARAPGRLGL